jgi:hypothetical protein
MEEIYIYGLEIQIWHLEFFIFFSKIYIWDLGVFSSSAGFKSLHSLSLFGI